MKKRTLALPLIVVTAVVAMVLGSFGSATAAGITSHTVKRIAAKVVDHKASSLSVAHAATATTATTASNATLLDGKAASTYLTSSYSYVLPTAAATTFKTWSFPGLPAGTYVANYSVLVSGGANMNCGLFNSTTSTQYEGFGYGVTQGAYTTVSSSAPLVVGAASPRLQCSGASFSIYPSTSGFSSRVTFTRVDSLGGGTAARGADSSRPSGGPLG